MGKFIDMTGVEFGDYIVDSFDNTRGEYKYYWNCHYIGIFENIEDAVKARKDAELKYFGELNRSKFS